MNNLSSGGKAEHLEAARPLRDEGPAGHCLSSQEDRASSRCGSICDSESSDSPAHSLTIRALRAALLELETWEATRLESETVGPLVKHIKLSTPTIELIRAALAEQKETRQ
jgi:hypothetical protein